MRRCSCCGREEDVVARCSALGPMSLGYCLQCRDARAEPYADTVIAIERGSVKPFVHNVTVYVDGKYLTVDQLVAAGHAIARSPFEEAPTWITGRYCNTGRWGWEILFMSTNPYLAALHCEGGSDFIFLTTDDEEVDGHDPTGHTHFCYPIEV